MPIIIEIARIVISALVVGYIAVLSFLGYENTENLQESSIPAVVEESTQRIVIPVEHITHKEEKRDEITENQDNTSVVIVNETQEVIPEIVSEDPIITMQEVSDLLPEAQQEVLEDIVTPTIDERVDLSFSDINVNTREALVNILCTTQSGGPLQPITGSGVIIDKRGVVLTNAHVAQFLLLRDYPTEKAIECFVRQGSPARITNRLELLYISPAWVQENASNIIEENPLGTGENDFALLLISSHMDKSNAISDEFAFVKPETDDSNIQLNNDVLLAGYPAGFLGGITIQKDLFVVSTIGKVKELFTFKEDTLDLVSVVGSILSQKGASGGAVVSDVGALMGIIVTATEEGNTGERELRAITLSHVNRSLLMHAGYDLPFLLFGDLWLKAGVFNLTIAPTLTKMLTDEIEK